MTSLTSCGGVAERLVQYSQKHINSFGYVHFVNGGPKITDDDENDDEISAGQSSVMGQ